jgi:hypothetical protein
MLGFHEKGVQHASGVPLKSARVSNLGQGEVRRQQYVNSNDLVRRRFGIFPRECDVSYLLTYKTYPATIRLLYGTPSYDDDNGGIYCGLINLNTVCAANFSYHSLRMERIIGRNYLIGAVVPLDDLRCTEIATAIDDNRRGKLNSLRESQRSRYAPRSRSARNITSGERRSSRIEATRGGSGHSESLNTGAPFRYLLRSCGGSGCTSDKRP